MAKRYVHSTRKSKAYGVCSFMNVNGFCNYIHMDPFGRINKEKLKKEGSGGVKEAGRAREKKYNEMGEGTRSSSGRGQREEDAG